MIAAVYKVSIIFAGVYKTTKVKSTEYQNLTRYLDLQNNWDPCITEQCEQYVAKVLSAIELKNGFAHTEVIHMTDQSFRLIEVNPRIAGVYGTISRLSDLALGFSQPTLLIHMLENIPLPSKKLEKIFYRILIIYNFNQCYEELNIDPIMSLASYYYHQVNKYTDMLNKKIENLTESCAIITLKNSNQKNLENDTQIILELEQSAKIFKNPILKNFN